MAPVMDAFCHLEERGIAVDDEPSCVHSGPHRVGDQHLEHLGDAATPRGRVDVPYLRAFQLGSGCGGHRHELAGARLVNHLGEARELERLHDDLAHGPPRCLSGSLSRSLDGVSPAAGTQAILADDAVILADDAVILADNRSSWPTTWQTAR